MTKTKSDVTVVESSPPAEQKGRTSLIVKMANRFSVEPEKMLATLKATAFKAKTEVTNEQMMTLLIVADQYGLNPFTRELFAFPDERGGIVPVVSIDGWDRIINSNPVVEDGPNFYEAEEQIDHNGKKVPEWIECTIKRRDRINPTAIRERFRECVRNTSPWGSHPARMLRHKALIQCARIALGYSGIYDQDEAERISMSSAAVVSDGLSPVLASLNAPTVERPAAAEVPATETPTPEGAPVEQDFLKELDAETERLNRNR